LAILDGAPVHGEGNFLGPIDILDGHFDPAHDHAVFRFDIDAIGNRDHFGRARRRRQDLDALRLAQRAAVAV
jgi:hypothetical protein